EAPDGTTHAPPTPVDVLILTALQDELDGILSLGDEGRAGWRQEKDRMGFRCYRRAFHAAHGALLLECLPAWNRDIGDRTAAPGAKQLVDELDAGCVAMCGLCAGDPTKVALGDVIVADQLYSYDEGKVVAEPGKPTETFHTLRAFDLQATWKMDAAFLARELDLTKLAAERPPLQMRWLLDTLYAHETEGGPAPTSHPDRARACPDWTRLLQDARKNGLVTLQASSLRLTQAGRDKVEEERILYPDGPPKMRIHVGAVATGHDVQQDPALFDRLRRRVRSTLAV